MTATILYNALQLNRLDNMEDYIEDVTDPVQAGDHINLINAYLVKFKLIRQHFNSAKKNRRRVAKIEFMIKSMDRKDLIAAYELIRAVELLAFQESAWRRFRYRKYWIWKWKLNKDKVLRRLKQEWSKK